MDAHRVIAAPPPEDIDGPDARPVEAGRTLKECAPQPADGTRVEADGLAEGRVAERSRHLVPEDISCPAIDREHEASLRPVEEPGIQPSQSDLAEDPLLAERLEALCVVQSRGRGDDL